MLKIQTQMMIMKTIKTVTTTSRKHVYATMHIDGTPKKFQIDRGASCNVIPVNKLKGINYELTKSSTVLTTYNKSEILPLGKTTLRLMNPKNGNTHKVNFVVVKQDRTSILENQVIQNMN